MHLPDGPAAVGAAAATCVATALLLPAPAVAVEPYPPPPISGQSSGFSTTFNPPAVQPAPASLPSTGRDVEVLIAAGGLGVAVGALVLALTRRRRTS